MSRKWVGTNVHRSTTSQIAVRDADGELLFDPISVQTEPEPMPTAIHAVSADVEVIFEAGTGSGCPSASAPPTPGVLTIDHFFLEAVFRCSMRAATDAIGILCFGSVLSYCRSVCRRGFVLLSVGVRGGYFWICALSVCGLAISGRIPFSPGERSVSREPT